MNNQPDDGTRGHSEGEWFLGDIRWSVSNNDHHIAMVNYGTTGGLRDYGKPNANLILLAPTAPHYCGNPACAGQQNAAKLALFDQMVAAFERIEAWDFDIMGDCVADARLVARVILSEIAVASPPTMR